VRTFALLMMLCAGAALAEQADSTKPTQIEANTMKADDARRTNTFEGNVVVTRGTLRIQADRIVVRQDKDGNQFATATGNSCAFASARIRSPRRRKARGWKARRSASSSTTRPGAWSSSNRPA